MPRWASSSRCVPCSRRRLFVEDEDAIGVLDGAEAMGDDDGGAAGEQAIERLADEHFGGRIHAGGGFVENEQARIVRQGAGKTDELALADGESGAAFADGRVESLRQRIEEGAEADFEKSALDGGAVDAFGAEADVGFERAGEEKWVLQDDAELAAQGVRVELAEVDAVKQDLAALDFVETQKQLDDGGFAGAGVADDGDGLARADVEGDIAQHPVFVSSSGPFRPAFRFFAGVAVIGEPDVAEFDIAAELD